MTRTLAIFASLLLVSSALAQDDLWSALRNSSNAYANQRTAIQAAVEEFTQKIQAAMAMPPDNTAGAEGLADVYPTDAAAIRALIDIYVAQMRSAPGFDEGRARIVVTKLPPDKSGIPELPEGNVGVSGSYGAGGFAAQLSPSITADAAQRVVTTTTAMLGRRMAHAKVMRDTGSIPTNSPPLVLGVGVGEIERIEQTLPVQSRGDRGKICMTFMSGGIERRMQARFDIRGWATDFKGFVGQQREKDWIVGRSDKAFSSPNEAVQSACDDASTQFAQNETGRVRIDGNALPFDTLKSVSMTRFLNRGTADRFVQQFNTPAGAGYRAAVLVSASPGAIRDIVPAAETDAPVTHPFIARSHWSFSRGGALIMLLVIGGLACFLRMVTGVRSCAKSGMTALLIGLILTFLVFALLGVRRVTSAPGARAVMVR